MFDINNYYLGVVLAHPSYFRNPQSKMRRTQDVESDPFQPLSFEQSIILGMETLLKREGDNYYDEYYSRYKNELCYQEKKTNRYGIVLAYQKPLLDYFEEEPEIFDEQSLFLNEEMIEDTLCYPYYVVYSKIANDYHVVINDDDVFSLVKEDYLTELLGEQSFQQMVQKCKKR